MEAIARGVDAEGFHRAPQSSCCHSGLVASTSRFDRFVPIEGDSHLVDILRSPRADIRCGRCNDSVKSTESANGAPERPAKKCSHAVTGAPTLVGYDACAARPIYRETCHLCGVTYDRGPDFL